MTVQARQVSRPFVQTLQHVRYEVHCVASNALSVEGEYHVDSAGQRFPIVHALLPKLQCRC